MTATNEWERNDLRIDPFIEVLDNGYLNVCIECWFDVDKKFGTDTYNDDRTWINLYANYNPFTQDLQLHYLVDSDEASKQYEYEPTDTEWGLIINMIEEACRNKGTTALDMVRGC